MKPTFRTSLATLALCVATGAQASTYIVTKTTDSMDGLCDSDCSLREAVQAANLHPGSDTIQLAAGRYVLSIPGIDEDNNQTGDLDLIGQLNIVGVGSATIIDGGHIDRVFDVPDVAFLKTYALSIVGGNALNTGGGIRNAGVVELTNTYVSGNSAPLIRPGTEPHFDPEAMGGGIANSGTLLLENCTVGFNTTDGSGSGISNTGTLYLRRSTIRNNRTSGAGAGIHNSGSAFIEQSLFVGNFSFDGTAIYNSGYLELGNSTVSGNSAPIFVGDTPDRIIAAILNSPGGTAKLSFVTITDNVGGGLLNLGTAALSGALIAGNLSLAYTGEPPDDNDPPNENVNPPEAYRGVNCQTGSNYSVRNSLIGLDGNCSGQLYVDNGTVFATLLEPLRLGGGVTASHKPRRGSVAVDAINPFSAPDACPALDQRGAHRPPNDDGRRGQYCDIGAYELRQ